MPAKDPTMREKESEEEKSARFIANLEKHIESQKESVKYSSDRFDILIDSLATGCLIFSMGFADEIVPDLTKADTSALKTTWLLFAGCLIANLISQVTGYFANKNEIRVSKNLIRVERGKEPKGNQKKTAWWCETLNNATLSLNGISLLLFICGILALVKFADANI